MHLLNKVSQVSDAMRRMHDRQNIGKVILIPEAKKAKEQPTAADAAAVPAEGAGTSATDDTKKEETVVEDKVDQD